MGIISMDNPLTAQQIQLLILDVDGVLTDGHIYFGPQGESLKAFHAHDGQGLKSIQQQHIQVAIITSRESPMVMGRMSELGVKHIYQGQSDKLVALKDVLTQLDIAPTHAAYMGDDLPDIPPMQAVGLGIAVANARPEVKSVAQCETQAQGGHGAVREVCDWLLKTRL